MRRLHIMRWGSLLLLLLSNTPSWSQAPILKIGTEAVVKATTNTARSTVYFIELSNVIGRSLVQVGGGTFKLLNKRDAEILGLPYTDPSDYFYTQKEKTHSELITDLLENDLPQSYKRWYQLLKPEKGNYDVTFRQPFFTSNRSHDDFIAASYYTFDIAKEHHRKALIHFLKDQFGKYLRTAKEIQKLERNIASYDDANWQGLIMALNESWSGGLQRHLAYYIRNENTAKTKGRSSTTSYTSSRAYEPSPEYVRERFAALKVLDQMLHKKLALLGEPYASEAFNQDHRIIKLRQHFDATHTRLNFKFKLKDNRWGGDLDKTYQTYIHSFDPLLSHMDSLIAAQNKTAQLLLVELGYLADESSDTFFNNIPAQKALINYLNVRNEGGWSYTGNFENVEHWHYEYLMHETKVIEKQFSELDSLGFRPEGSMVEKASSIYSYLHLPYSLLPLEQDALDSLIAGEKAWLSGVFGGHYLNRYSNGAITAYLAKRPGGIYEWITHSSDGFVTRVKGSETFKQVDKALGLEIKRASEETIQFARVGGFSNDALNTSRIQVGDRIFKVYKPDLKAFLNEESQVLKNFSGSESFDEWISKHFSPETTIVFYQDEVLGNMDFQFDSGAQLLNEVSDLYGTGLNIYNPQKLVALLNNSYGQSHIFYLTNDTERAKRNVKNDFGPLTAREIAISHDLEIEDYEMRKRVQKKIGRGQIDSFVFGDDLSTYKALILSGHKDENFLELLHKYGQRGDFKDKLILLMTCHESREVARMNGILENYGAREVLIFDQELRRKAVEEVLVAFDHLLKKEKGSFELLPMLRRVTEATLSKKRGSQKHYINPLNHIIPGKVPQ